MSSAEDTQAALEAQLLEVRLQLAYPDHWRKAERERQQRRLRELQLQVADLKEARWGD